MHLRTVFKTLAILVLIITGFMMVCGLIALNYREYDAYSAFTITCIMVGAVGLITLIAMKGDGREVLSTKDGFLLVSLSWFAVSAIGALPYYLSEAIPSYADAFFETISGFSTTGASILTNIEDLPKSILFWRSLTHWLGGMGIVVLTVAILPLLGIGGLQLIKAEAPGPTVDKITPRIAETAKYLWFIYLGLTVTQTILLMFGGMNFFDSVTHSFGTVATGGFSTKNASVGHYGSAYIDWVITIFMVLAGVNFVLHYKFITGSFKPIRRNTEFKAYLVFFFVSSTVIAMALYHGNIYETVAECYRYSAFQAASILTTTGFATADYEQWPQVAQLTLFMLMFIGGCSGSTGGGIKVIRIVTLLKQGFNEMKYLVHPRGVFTLRMGGLPVKKDIVYAISGFFFLYILILLVVAFIVATGGNDVITSLTTALATVGNIGPGFGLIGPSENYAQFPEYIKWVLSVAMLAGRLEIYTFLVIFTPVFWRK